MKTPRLREIPPIYTEESYNDFIKREIPDSLDMEKSRELAKMIDENDILSHYKPIFTKFASGKVDHGLKPKRCISFFERARNLVWVGDHYVR